MTSHVYQHFIGPLKAAFRLDSTSPTVFLETLANELSRYTETSLQNAAAEIQRSRRYPTFPTIAECIEACDRAPSGREMPKRPDEYRATWEMPILGHARKFVDDYEAAGQTLKAHYNRIMPGRYAESRRVLRDFESMRYSASTEPPRTESERASMRARVGEILMKYRTPEVS